MAQFKDMLLLLRTRNGLTQGDLGAILGMATSTISMYERGERAPSKEAIEAIADHFNVPVDYLLGRDTKQKDKLTAEVNQLFENLPEERKREALNYLRYLSAQSDNL